MKFQRLLLPLLLLPALAQAQSTPATAPTAQQCFAMMRDTLIVFAYEQVCKPESIEPQLNFVVQRHTQASGGLEAQLEQCKPIFEQQNDAQVQRFVQLMSQVRRETEGLQKLVQTPEKERQNGCNDWLATWQRSDASRSPEAPAQPASAGKNTP